MATTDSSPLSTPPASDTESKVQLKSVKGKLQFVPIKKTDSPRVTVEAVPKKRKRSPSPPHEPVLADNFDIAFLVAFRARFNDAFSRTVPHLGPQDLEKGVVDSVPSDQVESLLCGLLGLALNRKKPVEKGHYQRALEDAVTHFKSQWPKSMSGISPISGSKTFQSMDPAERLRLLRCLVLWSLSGSEVIQSIIKQSYKGNRQPDDLNQHLSIQPFGKDWDKRTYYLVEGLDDTCFRIYREKGRYNKQGTWIAVAGEIYEARTLANTLLGDGSQAGARLGQRIMTAIPRLEAGEEKRRKREYRQARRAAFSRPEPGFSLYEGRTRGRKINYAYSDGDDVDFEDSDVGSRKRTRGAADASKISNNEPTTTRSGRVTKPRDSNGEYGAEATSDAAERQRGEDSQSELPSVHIENGFNYEEYESAEDPSGAEDGQANESGYEDQGSELEENEDDLSDAAGDEELIPERRTLKVALRVPISSFGKLPTTNGASKMDAPPVLPDSGYNSISGEPMNVVRHPDTANALAM